MRFRSYNSGCADLAPIVVGCAVTYILYACNQAGTVHQHTQTDIGFNYFSNVSR